MEIDDDETTSIHEPGGIELHGPLLSLEPPPSSSASRPSTPEPLTKLKRKALSSLSSTYKSDGESMTFSDESFDRSVGAKYSQTPSGSEKNTSLRTDFAQSSSSSSIPKVAWNTPYFNLEERPSAESDSGEEEEEATLLSGSLQFKQDDIHYRKRRRNRITQSCLNCRTSKRKCDESRPCQHCIQLGLTGHCIYEIDDPALRDDPKIDEVTRSRDTYNSDGELMTIYTEEESESFNPHSGTSAFANPSSSSSVPQASMGPAVNLHWQLLPYLAARPNLFLHFDIAFPTSDIEYRQHSTCGIQRTPLCDADLDKPAADKELTKMVINFQHNPFEWDINVRRDEGIRVRDIFEAIYAAFDVPLTPHEKSLIPLRFRAGCEAAFRLRCNLAPVLPIVQQHQGWKRVDALLHETLFRGLTQLKPGGNWTLNLSGPRLRAKQDSNTMNRGRGRDVIRDALVPYLETTAFNSPPPLPDSLIEYQPPYTDQTANTPPKCSDIDLFNLPLSAAFVPSIGVDSNVITLVDSDVMDPSRNACRICNLARLSAVVQHGTLYTLLNTISPLIPEPSSDYTWAFFCRFIPLGALFDSPGRGHVPMILLDSDRASLVERLEANLEKPRNSMSWLHGPPGTGKSVIAYSLASRCRQKHILAGSFFFSHRHANCRSARSVVLAFAYQLGLSQPQAKEKIIAALDSDPGIISPSRDLREQFARLLIEPMEAVDWRSPSRVFVIDAIDQCQDYVPELISLLTRLLSHLVDVGLHIFFTSRDQVESVLIKCHIAPIISDIALERIGIARDIRSFLRQSFDKIHKRHRLQCRKPWPPVAVLDRLVDRVGPHFITGSIIVKFVESPDHDPTDRMDLIYHIPFNPSLSSGSSADAFYKSIIATADDPEQAYLHTTIVANLAVMLPCAQLDNLLNQVPNQKFDMRSVLSQLSPLVHIPDGHNSAMQVCHESLCDFLSDRLRCGEQIISNAVVHRLLAYSSLSVMIKELPDDSAFCLRFSRLATEHNSLPLGLELPGVAVYASPEPIPFLSTLRRITQDQHTELMVDPRARLALGYFCHAWQILQHLDLSIIDSLPAFRFLANLRTLPVLLAFPIFLSFESPITGQTPVSPILEHEPRVETLDVVAEIVKDVHAFKNQRRTGSGAFEYACTHWAYHLSLAEWDDDLRSILTVFMKQKLRPWLVLAWCLHDFETCLRTLCEVRELCLTANPPLHFNPEVQRTDANMEAEEADETGTGKRSIKAAVEVVKLEDVERIKRTAEVGKKRADKTVAETDLAGKTAGNDARKTTAAKKNAETPSASNIGFGSSPRTFVADHLGLDVDLRIQVSGDIPGRNPEIEIPVLSRYRTQFHAPSGAPIIPPYESLTVARSYGGAVRDPIHIVPASLAPHYNAPRQDTAFHDSFPEHRTPSFDFSHNYRDHTSVDPTFSAHSDTPFTSMPLYGTPSSSTPSIGFAHSYEGDASVGTTFSAYSGTPYTSVPLYGTLSSSPSTGFAYSYGGAASVGATYSAHTPFTGMSLYGQSSSSTSSNQLPGDAYPLHLSPTTVNLFSCSWIIGDDTLCRFEGALNEFKRHFKTSHLPGAKDTRIACLWQDCGRAGVMRRDSMWRHVCETHLGMTRNVRHRAFF